MGLSEANRWRGGRGVKKWSYAVGDLAETVGIVPSQMKRHIRKGTVDPADLASVLAFIREHSPAERTRTAKLLFAADCDPTKAAAALGITRSTLYRWAKG